MHSKVAEGLKEACLLSSRELNDYHQHGFLIVRKFFAPEVIAAFGREVDRLARERCDLIDPRNMRVRFNSNIQSGLPLFEVFDPVADLSPIARSITTDPGLLAVLHDIYGEQACLFKDKLIYKPPGAAGATLHQDWIAWPEFPESFLTVLVAIDPFTAESGATEVYPGLHKHGYLSRKDGQHHVLDASTLQTTPIPLLLNPGDIAIFSCFTPHVSATNHSASSRRAYFISYNAQSDGGNQYERHYREFHAWIRSKAPEAHRNQLYFK